MVVRHINRSEIDDTKKISSVCFDYPFIPEDLSKAYSCWDQQIAAFDDDGSMMSTLAVIPYKFYYEGRQCSANGIGNVTTYPQYRRRGAVKALFSYALREMYEKGDVFSYLYPFSEAFYGSFGYRRVTDSICYTFDLRGIPAWPITGRFELYEDGRADIMKKCQEIYDLYARRYNMMVKRDKHDWTYLEEAKAYINNDYLFLNTDDSGEPLGYIVFRKSDNDLKCREIIFRDYKSLQSLCAFAKTYSADYHAIRFHAPDCLFMESLCSDFAAYPAEITRAMNGMVRAVNIEKVLKLSHSSAGSCQTKIKIFGDSMLPENNGIYSVSSGKNGQAVSVSRSADTDTDYDISIPVNIFSAAIIGNYDINDLGWIPDVEITNPENASHIFYKKPSFINNYF